MSNVKRFAVDALGFLGLGSLVAVAGLPPSGGGHQEALAAEIDLGQSVGGCSIPFEQDWRAVLDEQSEGDGGTQFFAGCGGLL